MDERYKPLIKELKYIFFMYLFSILAFYAAFWKSGIFASIRISSAIFYLYLLPGFLILYFISDLKFIEKFFLGAVIGFTVVTVITYHLNIFFNISLKSSQIVPLIVILSVIGVDCLVRKRKESIKNEKSD